MRRALDRLLAIFPPRIFIRGDICKLVTNSRHFNWPLNPMFPESTKQNQIISSLNYRKMINPLGIMWHRTVVVRPHKYHWNFTAKHSERKNLHRVFIVKVKNFVPSPMFCCEISVLYENKLVQNPDLGSCETRLFSWDRWDHINNIETSQQNTMQVKPSQCF